MTSKLLSKYFATPLTKLERHQILNFLGLDQFSFILEEYSGKDLIQSRILSGGALTAQQDKATDSEPIIQIHYPSPLEVLSLQRKPSLWEEILPYPFGILLRLAKGNQVPSLEIEPAELNLAIKGLAEAFWKLEAELSATEISCLWLTKNKISLPILFHFVRGNRVQVGLGTLLSAELNEEISTSRSLSTYFGIPVSLCLFKWEFSATTSKQLVQLASALTSSSPNMQLNDMDESPNRHFTL